MEKRDEDKVRGRGIQEGPRGGNNESLHQDPVTWNIKFRRH